jgi:nucleoid-associated protein EbfC
MAKGMMGGNNLGSLMKQAQKMQAEMQKAQEELEVSIFEAQSGGGAVKVSFNGKKQMQSIIIQPEAVDPDDVEMLQDMVLAAVNQAMANIDDQTQEKMGRLTGGMKLPGF